MADRIVQGLVGHETGIGSTDQILSLAWLLRAHITAHTTATPCTRLATEQLLCIDLRMGRCD